MGRIFSVFLLTAIIGIAVFLVKKDELKAISPIPQIFGQSTENTAPKPVNNEWFPQKDKAWQNNNSSDLNLTAKSALLVNYDSKSIIYAKNADLQLPAASTIKIMTALIALEKSTLDKKFTVSEKAANVGEDSMGLEQGEVLSVKELLYGMMLPSGNDAAMTIAEGVAGTEEAFAGLMNERLATLGLSDTKFINASGLDVDGQDQYTTAYDLATIARFTWEQFPVFRQIVASDHYLISANATHKEYDLYNQTNLLTTYPGVRGIKPGFTWDAGWCLVTYAENNGKHLIGVILGSEDRRGEMKELLDYGFGKYGIKVEHPGLDF